MSILEEVFPHSAKQFRIFKFLIENDKWITMYALSKEARIKVRREYLDRLANLGILKKTELGFYRLNSEHEFVKALRKFFAEVGYTKD